MGGKSDFESQSWMNCSAPMQNLSGRQQDDVTGLIGQYAHGNEPSHHIAYLYNFTDAPDKTEYYVNKILREQYSDKPDGLSGNEDCGQMSAWYVMSSLGIYNIAPGQQQYPGRCTAVREVSSSTWRTAKNSTSATPALRLAAVIFICRA
jgi:putative alpha-1,2-mannosidase